MLKPNTENLDDENNGNSSSIATINTDAIIIGAGPTGLFAVFQLGLLGLRAVVIDALDKVGGQCSELYPDKPIYDIPALPIVMGQELTDRLMQQIAPFDAKFVLGERVQDKTKTSTGKWQVTTDAGNVFVAPNIIIAGGAGCFTPRRPRIPRIETYEGQSVFYAVKKQADFAGKDIVICGGGDSALDWTLALLPKANSLTLVHRRDAFRAAEHSVQQMRQHVEDGRMQLIIGDITELAGAEGKLESLEVRSKTDSTTIKANRLLPFYGLNVELGSLSSWGLDILDNKLIKVNTEDFESNIPGIFVAGDMCTYAGKLKLILSGFHEVALIAQAAFKRAKPDEKLVFRYTTSSTALQQRLKVTG